MSNSPTIRIFRHLVLAGAVVVSTGTYLGAQSSGGSFGDPSSTGSSQQTEFNKLPFRAAKNKSNLATRNVSAKPPIRLRSPSQPNQSQLAVQTKLQPLNGQATTPQGNSKQIRSELANQVLATPVGFRSPLPESNPQLSSQEPQVSQELPKYVDLDNCQVNFIDDILLPAKESGVIKSLAVKEGDYVPAGTVVGQIDDELYQRLLEQAKLRYEMATEAADDGTAIEAAQTKYVVATIEATKISKLADKFSKSESDRLMAVYSKDIASLERVTAVNEKRKAGLEKLLEAARYKEVETHIRGHVLQSDFDAYVIKILKKPQEYVRQGEEVMRIARMNRLWVQGTVDIAKLNPDEVHGRPVTITVDRARGKQETFEGRITSVGLERHSLTRYMVKAEVDNRPIGNHWMLQPLSTVKMKIHLDRAPAKDGSFESAGKPKVNR
jgi:hypothetical protein